MSGGVDSAVAALRAGDNAVAVTLELWRDPFNDGERSCCSASAVATRARPRAPHGPAAPHARPARRVPRRRGAAVAGGPRRGADAEPVRALQRPRAPRRDARPRRPRRRRDAGHRPLCAPHRRRPAAPGGRPRQGPGLHARRAAAAEPRADALPARRPHEGPGPGDRRRARAARRRQARLAGPLLPGRHRPRRVPRPPRRPGRASRGRSSTPRAASSARHRGHHDFTVGQRRGLGVAARASRCTSSARTRAPTRSPSGRGPSWPRRRARARISPAPSRRGGRRASSCATARPPWPAAAGRRRRRSGSPSPAPRRARPPSCCAATPCWDAPTIASRDDLRRDPRAFLCSSRSAATSACPAGRSCPPPTIRRCCSPRAGMQPLKPYFMGLSSRPRRA